MQNNEGTAALEASMAQHVWALLVQVAFDRVHRYFATTAAEMDLAPAQAAALQELRPDAPISMRELAGRLKCDPSNITGLIDRLEMRGLVERRAHPADRRIKYLVLTIDGQAVREQLAARLYAAPGWLSDLGESDQQALRELLMRVLRSRIA